MPMTVAEVIERLRAQGDVAKSFTRTFAKPKPLTQAELARLTLPSGDPLPADLAAWLAYDDSWLSLLKKGKTRRFEGAPLRKIMKRWLDQMKKEEDGEELEELQELIGEDVMGYWIKALPDPIADVHAIELESSSQDHLLILEPGRKSPRVLGSEKRVEFWWEYDSLGAYLARYLGLEPQA